MDIPADTAALIFDCDGTLVDTLPLYLKAWQAALQEVGGLDVEAAWFAGRGGYAEQMLLAAVEKSFGVTLDRPAIISATRRRVRETIEGLRCNVPVITVVREWAGRLPLAVASSGSREVVEASLAAIGLLDVFSAIVTIEDVEHPKPAPDIYLLAARKLGVDPRLCVVFEDSHEGLKAARAAGMMAEDVRPCSEFRIAP
ncbi:HAD-IA family hydrolase [Acetobacter oeni]|nr:HAD-IA family hydrolase [Acetobacter oeni]